MRRSWSERGVVVAAIAAIHVLAVVIFLGERSRAQAEAPAELVMVSLSLPASTVTRAEATPINLSHVREVAPVLPHPEFLAEEPAPTAIMFVQTATPPQPAEPEELTAGSPQVVTDLQYLRAPPAAYPVVAQRDRREGTVYVRVLVNEAGAVEQLEVEKSCGYRPLDEAALTAVRAWIFRPYEVNGIARPVVAIVPVKFSLRMKG